MTQNFIIGSGYHPDGKSFQNHLWLRNTEKYASPKDVYIICTEATRYNDVAGYNQILLNHNLGHVHHLIEHNRSGLTGWGQSVLTLALIAYGCGKDLIFKEQDCFWVGDVVGQLYRDCEGKNMVFGPLMKTPPGMSCAQSTFLIKHEFLLQFVYAYLELDENEKSTLTEDKFCMLENTCWDVGRMSFGVDRERPIPYDQPTFYVQQCTLEELKELEGKGLI